MRLSLEALIFGSAVKESDRLQWMVIEQICRCLFGLSGSGGGKHNGMKQGLEMSKSTQASCGRASYIYMKQRERGFRERKRRSKKRARNLRAWQDTQAFIK